MKALVIGQGYSREKLDGYDYYIGVNDCRFDVDCVVCVDPPHRFDGERFRHMMIDKKPMFTNVPIWGGLRPNVTSIELTKRRSDISELHLKQNYAHSICSPYVAVVHAYFMGATEIGINGVDLFGHKAFDTPEKIARVQTDFSKLATALNKLGVSVYLATDKIGALTNILKKSK